MWQYGTCLYGNDYVLVGTYDLPFVRRGGDWYDYTRTGVFAFYGSDGSAFGNKRFSPGGCYVVPWNTKIFIISIDISHKRY